MNEAKIEAVKNIKGDFQKDCQQSRYNKLFHLDTMKEDEMQNFDEEEDEEEGEAVAFSSIAEMISHQLDSFETDRLLGQLPIKNEKHALTFR